jgi:acetyl-CoA C-acetyltransferase
MNTTETQPPSYAQTLTIPEVLLPVERELGYSRDQAALQKDDIVICYPVRSGIGNFSGAFAGMPAHELGPKVVSELLDRTGRGDIYDKVDALIAGQVIQDGMNPAEQVKTYAGIRESASAYTINMACGSGLKAVLNAASAIRARAHTGIELAVAGGFENMSRAPSLLESNRSGFGLGGQTFRDGVLASLTDAFEGVHMGVTAERLANLPGRPPITRADADYYALRSQRRAELAWEAGYFKDTVVPIDIKQGRETVSFKSDEAVRGRKTTLEGLARLKPAFTENGIVTPGNASGISDGAAFMIVTTAGRAEELGLEVSMRLLAEAEAGVAPGLMGLGPIPATEKALGRAGLIMADIDTFELNEAFANVALLCGQALDVTDAQLNPLGGAIAHGHPIGATGGVLVTKIDSYFKHNPGSQYALASLCIGGGQGITAAFDRV